MSETVIKEKNKEPKVLIISTIPCSYPGIDNAGQKHIEYTTHTYVVRVPDPVVFPTSFYLDVFKAGYDGIYIASCGTDNPYKGTYDILAKRIDETVAQMKKEGIHYSRIKLTAICTVCADHFVHELMEFYNNLKKLD